MSDTQVSQPPQADAPRLSSIGKKFTSDGAVMHFPGNTIVCHLSPDSDVYKCLFEFREKLKDIVGHKVTWLPKASWHMTVFEGVCDQVRNRNLWPADLGLDATLEDCHQLFTERLSSRPLEEQPPYRCRLNGVKWKDGVSFHVQPDGEDLRKLRNKLSAITGIRHPLHETYGFHITLAYAHKYFTDAEKQAVADAWRDIEKGATVPAEFELGAPEYCLFDDMFEFRRQFYLGA